MSGMKRGNCAAPTEPYYDLSVSQHWTSISSIWRLVGALSMAIANRLLSSSNLHFWASKSANRRVNSAPSALSFSANCALGNTPVEICSLMFGSTENGPSFLAASESSTGTTWFGMRLLMNVNRRCMRVLIDAPTL